MEDGGAGGDGTVYRACAQQVGVPSGVREYRADGGAGGRDRSPGAGSQRGAVASGMFWFCFQKCSRGLTATFKDLKIWKQALGERSTENSSGEYGKC